MPMPPAPAAVVTRSSASPVPQPRSSTTASAVRLQRRDGAVDEAGQDAGADAGGQQARAGVQSGCGVAGRARAPVLRLEQVQIAAAGDVEGVPAVAGVGGGRGGSEADGSP